MIKGTLSPDATAALVNVGTNRQGATVHATGDAFWELEAAGLIGIKGGLTRAGSIYRQNMMDRLMDAAF